MRFAKNIFVGDRPRRINRHFFTGSQFGPVRGINRNLLVKVRLFTFCQRCRYILLQWLIAYQWWIGSKFDIGFYNCFMRGSPAGVLNGQANIDRTVTLDAGHSAFDKRYVCSHFFFGRIPGTVYSLFGRIGGPFGRPVSVSHQIGLTPCDHEEHCCEKCNHNVRYPAFLQRFPKPIVAILIFTLAIGAGSGLGCWGAYGLQNLQSGLNGLDCLRVICAVGLLTVLPFTVFFCLRWLAFSHIKAPDEND